MKTEVWDDLLYEGDLTSSLGEEPGLMHVAAASASCDHPQESSNTPCSQNSCKQRESFTRRHGYSRTC